MAYRGVEVKLLLIFDLGIRCAVPAVSFAGSGKQVGENQICEGSGYDKIVRLMRKQRAIRSPVCCQRSRMLFR
jgi:hypothetical protein